MFCSSNFDHLWFTRRERPSAQHPARIAAGTPPQPELNLHLYLLLRCPYFMSPNIYCCWLLKTVHCYSFNLLINVSCNCACDKSPESKELLQKSCVQMEGWWWWAGLVKMSRWSLSRWNCVWRTDKLLTCLSVSSTALLPDRPPSACTDICCLWRSGTTWTQTGKIHQNLEQQLRGKHMWDAHCDIRHCIELLCCVLLRWRPVTVCFICF